MGVSTIIKIIILIIITITGIGINDKYNNNNNNNKNNNNKNSNTPVSNYTSVPANNNLKSRLVLSCVRKIQQMFTQLSTSLDFRLLLMGTEA